ncbi:MAG TPA: carboxypeptidase-like regulatory domain-containing protein, partial [Saprospiraceae bacterium]|nr:carboxypeptidase-like regulatory domain-containing protein [Saprospiraceae bacterium]
MILRVFFLFMFFIWLSKSQSQSLNGLVLDENNDPLIGAIVILTPGNYSTVTDLHGRFSYSEIMTGKYKLLVSYIGYSTKAVEIETNGYYSDGLIIRMEPKEQVLDIIHITDEHAKQEMTLMARHFTRRLMEENLQGTFSQSIEKIPGISAINVGVGIAKPVIRGLSSNRILVNQQGIKQEGHQWGADHGLEIDQFDVERVEIIKGP